MAKKSLILKSEKEPKFKVRKYSRCLLCGRSRAVYRKFKMCRLCFRGLSLRGDIPGVIKASW